MIRIISLTFIGQFLLSTPSIAHREQAPDHETHQNGVTSTRVQQNQDPTGTIEETNSSCRQLYDCLLRKTEGIDDLGATVLRVNQMLNQTGIDQVTTNNLRDFEDRLMQCRNYNPDERIQDLVNRIDNIDWISGSPDCDTNKDPIHQVERIGNGLTILRQNKCNTVEAPFMYLLESEDKVMLIDSGDIRQGTDLYDQVKAIAGDREIVVAHSHAHGDHTQGDRQFRGKDNCTVVGHSRKNVQEMFNIEDWPNGQGTFDMGDRELKIIPVPGHEGSSIAIYDPKSKMMMTGDIMYPGRLYIGQYGQFKDSLDRLKAFSEENEVAAYLGGHVEMSSTPGVDNGFTNYAETERSLVLRNSDLHHLNEAAHANTEERRVTMDQFIIYP